jgi:preprotein translocase subunit SecB
MSETESQAPEAPAAADPHPEVPIVIHTQYVKDLSFENPNAPQILTDLQTQPKLDVQLDVGARRLQGQLYEVTLKINVSAKIEERTAFMVELDYGGLATVGKVVPEDKVEATLLIQGAAIIFPFARRILADATRDGGFPPVLINAIDFAQLHDQRRQRQAEQPAGNGSTAPA